MDDPGAQYLSKDPGLSHETEKVLFDLDLEVLWAAISLALAVQPIVVCASEQCLSASSLSHHSRSLKVLVHGYLVLGEHRHQGLFELFCRARCSDSVNGAKRQIVALHRHLCI